MLALRKHRKDNKIKRKAKPATQCTVTELYNALQQAFDFMSPSFILFDIRNKQQYDESHIISAINIDCTKLFDTKINTESIQFEDLSSSKPIKHSELEYKMIYIYHNYSSNNDEEKKSNETATDIDANIDILHCLLRNTANVSSIKTLNGTFSAFNAKYPFLCIETKDDNQYTESYPNEIIEDKVFLGDAMHCKSWDVMQNLNITHIINVTDTVRNHFVEHKDVDITYLNIKIDDANSVNIHQFFDECNEFIDKVMNMDKCRVFVHCQMGVSRSATIVIAYVMYKYKYSFQTAWQYVKQRRSCVCPNESFETQLQEYEKVVFDTDDDSKSE